MARGDPQCVTARIARATYRGHPARSSIRTDTPSAVAGPTAGARSSRDPRPLGPSGGVLDPRGAERVGVRVLANLHHPSDDDPGESVPRVLDAFDQDAARDQGLREDVRLQVGRRELAQPRQGNAHQAAPNCSRNRTSPSISIRMSGIAYLRIATRSMPRPNANPVYRSLS